MKPIVECKQCGECCKVFAVKRVSKTKQLMEYATIHGYSFDGDTLLIPSRCPHLTEDNKCDIYATRPQICRDYNGRSKKYYTPKTCVYR